MEMKLKMVTKTPTGWKCILPSVPNTMMLLPPLTSLKNNQFPETILPVTQPTTTKPPRHLHPTPHTNKKIVVTLLV